MSLQGVTLTAHRHPGLPLLWLQCGHQHHNHVSLNEPVCVLWTSIHCHIDALQLPTPGETFSDEATFSHAHQSPLTLQIHPCRAALDKILSRHSTTGVAGAQAGHNASPDHDERNDAVGDDDEGRQTLLTPASQSRRPEEMSIKKLCILTAFLLASTFVIALCVDDLGLVLGFVGSIGSTTISFIVSGAASLLNGE